MNEILQKRIEEAAEAIVEDYNHYQFLNDGTKDVYTQSAVLFMLNEMAQFILNNQWISCEEGLPTERDEEDEQYSTNVFARTKDCIRYAYYDFYNESWCSVEGGYRFGGDVTHWMEIPSLKGGEK